jgi:uncharacterized protein with FMN-binding domain
MKKDMNRKITAFIMAALAAIPAVNAWAASHGSTQATKTSTKSKTSAKTKKYTGPLVDMRWGPVQAIIYVKSKKITKVSIVTNPENFRSQFIDQQAVPLLQQETLQSQNANIDDISGATMTSEAYVQSLASALKKAHLPTGLS